MELERQIVQFNQIQRIINAVLAFSVKSISFEEQLQQILEMVLSIDWLCIEAKGCIFLADNRTRTLEMVVHKGMSESQLANCRRLPFGRCLCGRAAERREMIFCAQVDESHEIQTGHVHDHGHFCVPILDDAELLGVINLYVTKGHQPIPCEEDFLRAVANAMAGLIIRQRTQEDLLKIRQEMESIVRRRNSQEIFNDHVIQGVYDQWNQGEDKHRWPPPRADYLQLIMETVFQASLKKKEEIPIQISVTLLEYGTLLDEMDNYDSLLLRFENPQTFSLDTLAAVAPSFDPGSTSLLLVPREDGKGLTIIGAVFFSRRGLHRFDAMTYAFTPLDLLSVTAKKPGHLVVFRGNEIIGCFFSGKLSDPMPTTFTKGPMAWYILNIIGDHPEHGRHGAVYWDAYLDLVDRLLLEAIRRGRGGTLIWVPEFLMAEARRHVDMRYPLRDSPNGSTFLDRFIQVESKLEKETMSSRERAYQEARLMRNRGELLGLVELVSQLTAMDGAVILSDRLQPLSFGSMLTSDPWPGKVLSWRPDDDVFPTLKVDPSHFGARHNSALNFVARCPGSIAFVISQDGLIAGLASKDEDTVYWWPDCLSKLCDV